MSIAGYVLSVERHIKAPRASVWRCWTEGELLKPWFCPAPWKVTVADLDPRPGGRMNTVMEGPEGERVDGQGCFVEVVPGRKLAFTDAMTEGFVPTGGGFMTGTVELSDSPDGGTHMVWSAVHGSQESVEKHLEMGWEPGWNAVADALARFAEGVEPVGQRGDWTPLGEVMKGVIPYLALDQAEEAIAFYKAAFGAREVGEPARTPDGKIMNSTLVINGGCLMISHAFPEMGAPSAQGGRGFTLQLVALDGEAWWSRAVAAGCKVTTPFALQSWGDRWGALDDPFGVSWALNEPSEENFAKSGRM